MINAIRRAVKATKINETVYHGDWVRHPDNQWQIGQIQTCSFTWHSKHKILQLSL